MPKRAITADDVLSLFFVGDPQISPDGHRILFSRKHIDGEKNRYVTQLYVVDLDGHVSQWTGGEKSCSMGRWSRDGKFVVFISGREEETAQFFYLPTTGGEAHRISNLPEGSIGDYRLSPDGKKIAFAFRGVHPDFTKAGKAEREKKHLSPAPRIIEDSQYRYDGDGYFLGERYKLYVLDIESGEHRELYAAAPNGDYSLDWNPNSEELIVAHTANRRPMFEKSNDQLFRVDMTGNAWQLEGMPKGSKFLVNWSPDGKSIAWLGDLAEDGWEPRNTHLFVAPAEGGSCVNLTQAHDYSLSASLITDTKESYGDSSLVWSPDSKAIYFTVGWHGAVQIGFCRADTPGVEFLTAGEHFLGLGSVSPDGQHLAVIYGTATRPNEVGVLDLGQSEPNVLTRFNAAFLEDVKLSKPEEFWVEAADGHRVQAWVMYPIEYLPPKRYPAVLEVHGGPHAAYGWAFFHEFQVLAAQGYTVVYSNPRGSTGYGEEHACAIAGTWGDRDWEDIQAVTRWMQHQPFIHPGQMAVMGGSYGGYMTNWVIGHTRDFAAAITDRCVSNLVSFAGNHDFVMVKDGYFKGSFFGDMSHLWKSSPIAYFDGVTTPTLIIHSEQDLRCNIEQAEQVFSALQHQGVESRFVRYPMNTSHGMSRSGPPDMRLHRLGEICAWYEKHLKV
jgi:dipeptidyl aminopeptidase/acylaminoacyl peptidase